MTLRQLQEFLDEEKWKDSEAHACDMCGRYARCRYCVRTEEFPCASAHRRLVEVLASPTPERIPEWLLPEPDVAAKFGTEEISPEAPARRKARPAPPASLPAKGEAGSGKKEGTPAPAPVHSVPVPAAARASDRPHVIVRAKRGDVRLFSLQRRIPTVSSELGEQD